MKYIVLTTKHHDGFCLWDTKQTDYNIMNSPFKRDVVKELAAACKKQGIAFGTYYSTCDWYHPDFPLTSPGGKVRREKSDIDSYNRYLLAQISELITNYGPLLTIWNDVPQEFKGRGAATIKMVRELQPDILINNRTGDGGDYDTPEQRVGKYQDDRPWETCMTICRQWAWKPNDDMKSLKQCLQTLVTCAARRRQPALQRRPDAGRRHRGAPGRAAQGNGRLAGEERRKHLRHARRPVEADARRRQHPQGQHGLSAPAARGGWPGRVARTCLAR